MYCIIKLVTPVVVHQAILQSSAFSEGVQIDAFSRTAKFRNTGPEKLYCLHLGVFVLLNQTLCKKQCVDLSFVNRSWLWAA